MTLLEVHKCDICGKTFYVPEEPLRKLKLVEEDKDILDYDLCFNCKESLMKWILAEREK